MINFRCRPVHRSNTQKEYVVAKFSEDDNTEFSYILTVSVNFG